MSGNQRSAKAKIMFEMSEINSNMFFLISNVIFEFCGKFFRTVRNALFKMRKKAVFSNGEIKSRDRRLRTSTAEIMPPCMRNHSREGRRSAARKPPQKSVR